MGCSTAARIVIDGVRTAVVGRTAKPVTAEGNMARADKTATRKLREANMVLLLDKQIDGFFFNSDDGLWERQATMHKVTLVVLVFFGCVGNPSWDDGARSSSRQLLRQVDDVFFGSCLFRVPTSRTKRFFQKPMRKILNCKTPSLSVVETPFPIKKYSYVRHV